MQTWLRRGITGLIFSIVMLGGVYAGPLSFTLLFALISVLCLWEFYRMVLPNDKTPGSQSRLVLAMLCGIAPFTFSALYFGGIISQIHILWAGFLLVFVVFLFELFQATARPFDQVAYIALAAVYIGIPLALLNAVAFKSGTYQPKIIIGFLLLTWMNDSAAYVFGSLLGRHPLFPRVSPKKTWEGTIGGVLLCIALAAGLYYWFGEVSMVDWLALGAIVSVFGTLGDLVESMLKRSFQIKDSGSLLPGHGGLLDRFDAFIFMLPFAAFYLFFLS